VVEVLPHIKRSTAQSDQSFSRSHAANIEYSAVAACLRNTRLPEQASIAI
jgi:hypothetical protein